MVIISIPEDCQSLPSPCCCLCAMAETTFHTLEEAGVVEYCTTVVGEPVPTVVTAVEAPVELLSPSPPLTQGQAKPQELKSRIALNSARLLQEQRVTNVHIRQIAQHMEGQNELLQMMRRSQEAQAYAQERQAQALEGTQAALLALVQMLRPALKDLRKFLQQGGAEVTNSSSGAAAVVMATTTAAAAADAATAESSGAEDLQLTSSKNHALLRLEPKDETQQQQ